MADSANAAPKPSSSVKLVLLGEAAVGKVRKACILTYFWHSMAMFPGSDSELGARIDDN